MGSKSSSSQAQSTKSYADESLTSAEDKAINIRLSDTGKAATVNLTQSGFAANDVIDFATVIGGGARDLVKETADQVRQASEPAANIAQAATGSQTEAGRMIGQLAVPLMLTVLGAAYLMKGRK